MEALVRATNGFGIFEKTAPGGAVLIRKWLEGSWLRQILILKFTAADQSLLDKRRKGGKPIKLALLDAYDDEGRAILQDNLKSGRLRILKAFCRIPFLVMEAIIENFRRNPEDYARGTLLIDAIFDDTTGGKLEEMCRNGLCHMDRDEDSKRIWVFEAGEKSLYVEHVTGTWNNNEYSIRTEREERF